MPKKELQKISQSHNKDFLFSAGETLDQLNDVKSAKEN